MPNNVIIRSIRESDAPSIYAVALEAWQYTYGSIFDGQFIENFVNRNYAPEVTLSLFPRIRSGTMCFYVAEYESNVIGFCNIGIDQQRAELYRIYLLPAYIGQGIGRKLLEYSERFLSEHNIDTYFCFVHKDNEIGKRFYLRYGFQHIPEKDREDEWYMERNIMSYPAIFTYTITVPQSAIDEYGHVNNVIFVQWMQDAAIRHGGSIPEYKQPENTGWFVREHRIEYLAPAYLGDEIEVRTWLTEMKRVRARRKYELIRKADGKVIARGETQWIFVELTTGRPMAIPPGMLVLFPVVPDQADSTASVV